MLTRLVVVLSVVLVAVVATVPAVSGVTVVGSVPVVGRDGKRTCCTIFSMFMVPSLTAVLANTVR